MNKATWSFFCFILCVVSSYGIKSREASMPTMNKETGKYQVTNVHYHTAESETSITKSQQAFNQIKPELDRYKAKVSPDQLSDLVNYLGYYRSWYQSVSPAPRDLTEKLSKQSNNLVNLIRKNAEPFVTDQSDANKSIVGASKLSQDGDEYYQMIIDYLNQKISSIPRPQRVY